MFTLNKEMLLQAGIGFVAGTVFTVGSKLAYNALTKKKAEPAASPATDVAETATPSKSTPKPNRTLKGVSKPRDPAIMTLLNAALAKAVRIDTADQSVSDIEAMLEDRVFYNYIDEPTNHLKLIFKKDDVIFRVWACSTAVLMESVHTEDGFDYVGYSAFIETKDLQAFKDWMNFDTSVSLKD